MYVLIRMHPSIPIAIWIPADTRSNSLALIISLSKSGCVHLGRLSEGQNIFS